MFSMSWGKGGTAVFNVISYDLRRRATQYEWGVCWRGTPAELIGAGVVQPGELPGDPGRAKTCYTAADGRKFSTVTPRKKFAVRLNNEHALELARRDAALQRFLEKLLEA